MTIIAGLRFDKELDKILKRNPVIAKKIYKTLGLLARNKSYPSLRLHKLTGCEDYSISVDMSIRIIIRIKGEDIFLLRIGKHEEVY